MVWLRKLLSVLGALLICYGIYAAVGQGVTFYRDYQEFKLMRAWIKLQIAEKKAREQRQAQPQAQTPNPEPQVRQ